MDPVNDSENEELKEFSETIALIKKLKPVREKVPEKFNFNDLYRESQQNNVVFLKRRMYSLLTAAAVLMIVFTAPVMKRHSSYNDIQLVQTINNEVSSIEEDLEALEGLYLVENDFLASEISEGFNELSDFIYMEV